MRHFRSTEDEIQVGPLRADARAVQADSGLRKPSGQDSSESACPWRRLPRLQGLLASKFHTVSPPSACDTSRGHARRGSPKKPQSLEKRVGVTGLHKRGPLTHTPPRPEETSTHRNQTRPSQVSGTDVTTGSSQGVTHCPTKPQACGH